MLTWDAAPSYMNYMYGVVCSSGISEKRYCVKCYDKLHILENGRTDRCLTHYDHVHFYLKIVGVTTESLRVVWCLFTNISCWRWRGHHSKALPLLQTTLGRGRRRLLVNRCRSHWSRWRNSAVLVSSFVHKVLYSLQVHGYRGFSRRTCQTVEWTLCSAAVILCVLDAGCSTTSFSLVSWRISFFVVLLQRTQMSRFPQGFDRC